MARLLDLLQLFIRQKKKGAGIRTESMGYPDLYDHFSTGYLDSVTRRDEFGDSRRRYFERSTGEKFGDLNKEGIPEAVDMGTLQVDGPNPNPIFSWRFVSKSRRGHKK